MIIYKGPSYILQCKYQQHSLSQLCIMLFHIHSFDITQQSFILSFRIADTLLFESFVRVAYLWLSSHSSLPGIYLSVVSLRPWSPGAIRACYPQTAQFLGVRTPRKESSKSLQGTFSQAPWTTEMPSRKRRMMAKMHQEVLRLPPNWYLLQNNRSTGSLSVPEIRNFPS